MTSCRYLLLILFIGCFLSLIFILRLRAEITLSYFIDIADAITP